MVRVRSFGGLVASLQSHRPPLGSRALGLGKRPIRRIALVEPNATTTTFYSGIRIPRQGAVLLGTILAERGYQVEVQIEDIQPLDWSGLLAADLVGISTITPTAPQSYMLADALRAASIPVVLGGVHVTFLPDEGLEHADFVVRGEGEDTIVELVRAVTDGGDLSQIRGLSFHADGQKVHNPDRRLECDLDRYPVPDFSLVRGMRPGGVVTVLTRRGCPFNCSFCCVAPFNGRWPRETSVERTLAEVEQQMHWLGRGGVLFFADDIFNLKPERMKEILRGMIDRGLTPLWVAQVRHEAARDPELLDLMRRSNCLRVFIGFESVNPRTLDAYDKHETVGDIIEAIDAFHSARIKVHGMFVAGSDEDTLETVFETTRFAIAHDLDSMQINVLTPLPGSRFFQEVESSPGRLLPAPWTFYDGQHVVHVPARVSPPVLQEAVTEAMARFYSLKAVGRSLGHGDLAEAGIRAYAWWFVRRTAREFRAYADWLSGVCVAPPTKARRDRMLTEWRSLSDARRVAGSESSTPTRRTLVAGLGGWLHSARLALWRLVGRLRGRLGLPLARLSHLPGAPARPQKPPAHG